MSAGNLALIACVPGLGLMLWKQVKKNQRARLRFHKNDREHGDHSVQLKL